jgi:hypothetical protein
MCVGDLKYYEIDHVLPFDFIKCEFLKVNPPTAISFDKDSANTCRQMFRTEDHEYEIKWNDYHQEHATYQVLCKPCNLKKGKNKGSG